MSAAASVLNACPTLQVDLDENWRNCHSLPEPLPFLEFINSPENRENIKDIVYSGNSQIRTVDVKYNQRIAESAVNSNQDAFACTATTKRADYVKQYTIDTNQNHQVEALIDLKDFNVTCMTAGQYMAGEMQRLINALVRKVATTTATQAVALVGAWASDVTVDAQNELNVKTFVDGSTSTLYPYTMEDIDEALKKSGYCDSVAIFGGSTLWKYFRRVQAGCCSDTGVDLRTLFDAYGKAVIWDRKIKDAYNDDDKNLVVQRGALQLLTFSQFEGHPLEGGDYRRFMINDPGTGLPIDVTVKDECGSISMVLTATTKVIALPDNMFANGDVYDGVTYAATVEVVNV